MKEAVVNFSQMLQQTGVIESISRELKIDERTARAGAGALLPPSSRE